MRRPYSLLPASLPLTRTRKTPVSRILLLGLLTLLTACAVTQEPDSQDAGYSPAVIDTIAILPPDVSIVYMVFNGDNTRLTQQEQRITQLLVENITQRLHQRGYYVRDLRQSRAWKRDPELRFQFQALKQSFHLAVKDLQDTTQIVYDNAPLPPLGVGPLANRFAQASRANALLLVRYSGFQKSEALVAKQVVSNTLLGAVTGSVAVPQRLGGELQLALLDAVSGEILWTDSADGEKSALELAQKLLAQLPAPTTATPPVDDNTPE